MGKPFPTSTTRPEHLTRFINFNPDKLKPSQNYHYKPSKENRLKSVDTAKSSGELKLQVVKKEMENSNRVETQANRLPLSEVVSECVRRWFQDTLKEAKAGDVSMQVLVGQMYFSGYGVHRDAHKGRIWISRASRCRSSVWKVSDKHPGYNASDSDSDELKGDS
ncbi:hypothetical protein RJ641_024514 [Dillenia turbinata]|uniref:Uncharacterized protein n=1 Tax=Dillenia turbinata TaxID=194707 RepID=A0AAN8ZN07_9MAGN